VDLEAVGTIVAVVGSLQKKQNTLIKLLDSDNPTVQSNAANSILDRGFGKAIQAVESKTVVAVVEHSPLDIARKAAFLLDNAQRVEDSKLITKQDGPQAPSGDDLQ